MSSVSSFWSFLPNVPGISKGEILVTGICVAIVILLIIIIVRLESNRRDLEDNNAELLRQNSLFRNILERQQQQQQFQQIQWNQNSSKNRNLINPTTAPSVDLAALHRTNKLTEMMDHHNNNNLYHHSKK